MIKKRLWRIVPAVASIFVLPIAASSLSSTAIAAPMGFSDSWMIMGDMNPDWQEIYANYAFTPWDAVGVEHTRMRSDDKTTTLELSDLTYTHLVHRWNTGDAQANIWFFTGLGAVETDNQSNRVMISPGVQFDYETRRIYFAATARAYRASDINHDFASVRGGFSLYETEYDETQPWLIVEARRMHDLSDKTEITPMLRLINKNFFIEAGVNNSHQARLNFMLIF